MKKLISVLLTAAFLACNNETTTKKTQADSVPAQDNTIVRDTGVINSDTTSRKIQ
jgi:hypothetical protein